jgi:hypothetical protein
MENSVETENQLENRLRNILEERGEVISGSGREFRLNFDQYENITQIMITESISGMRSKRAAKIPGEEAFHKIPESGLNIYIICQALDIPNLRNKYSGSRNGYPLFTFYLEKPFIIVSKLTDDTPIYIPASVQQIEFLEGLLANI